MCIPGARVQDVAELEKILKRPITLLDITYGTIFNSKKYRFGKYKEIEMVVHNGHAFSRNHYFLKDRMVEYYKEDTWEAINNALQGPQAIWLMEVGDENQRVSQFVLEDGHAFRTWIKHTDIIKACKKLFEDAGHQPQYTHLQASMLAYAHINLLEMLQRFDPNEVVRIATDFIHVRKDALYKIENILAFFKQVEIKSNPNLCSYYPSCAMCSNPEEFFILKLEYPKWIKEFLKTKIPLAKYNCKRHKLFICRFCFGEWFYSGAEIQPGQWCDKSEKIYSQNSNIVYWLKNRHWESIKDIPDSIASTIYDPITRCRNSYLNGRGGSTKDFREKHNVCMVPKHILEMFINYLLEHKCQHADYYEEVLTDYQAKCPKLCEFKKGMRRKNNRVQLELFREAIPVIEK
ncbi:12136_t:CDS:2 [Cetraspora pellucida]|uniref:12136_t:CDS:1 n=1 Tax=Cetraspora pellucida TaxID=1433469 RepID=A0A9N9BPX1_9GLOM|nr:12136_t:CDS:2 [Cetraspora pellucida]